MLDFFIVGIFVVGIVLALLSQRIDDRISGNCADKKVFNASKGLVVLATAFIVGSISYLVSQMTCSKTFGSKTTSLLVFVSFFLLLGIALIVLGIRITANLQNVNNIDNEKCLEAKEISKQVTYLGVLMTVLCIGYLGYRIYSAEKIVLKGK